MENELKDKIISNNFKARWLNKFTNDEIKELKKEFNFFDKIKTFKELKYCIINNIKNLPKCPVCGKDVTFHNILNYTTFCGKVCRESSQGRVITKENQKKGCIEKWGVINPFQSEEVKLKIKNTNLEKYGVENPMHNEEFKARLGETNLKKYGTVNPMQNEDIRDKAKKTNLERYGFENSMQNEDIREKAKKTNLEKYGVENVFSSEYIKDKLVRTKRRSYWEIFNLKLNLKGVAPEFSLEDYTNSEGKLPFRCSRCGKTFYSSGTNSQHVYCPNHRYRSRYEEELYDFVKSICPSSKIKSNARWYPNNENDQFFQELDIYIEDLNLGIDFHGLYWHSDINKSETYHQDKYKFFESKGIEVIQVFESDWVHKRVLVNSIIKNRLGRTPNSIFARKCVVKEINNKEYKLFCEGNHIQGYSPAKIVVGLFYKNSLVQIVSFGKPRFNKNYEYEIIRSCSRINSGVVGGFNRILAYFVKNYNPKSIITYADLKYFTGNSYLSAGFTESSKLTYPSYYYFKGNDYILYHRSNFQKHKLKDKLEFFDDDLTEYENMLKNNYLRIFDAGNKVFVKEFN